MSPADREQIEIFEQYLMRVDWHLLVARYSEAQIRRWIELGDFDAQQKQESQAQEGSQDEGGDDRGIVPLKSRVGEVVLGAMPRSSSH